MAKRRQMSLRAVRPKGCDQLTASACPVRVHRARGAVGNESFGSPIRDSAIVCLTLGDSSEAAVYHDPIRK